MLAASTIKLEEGEFVVDSGASMHMVSKRDFNSAELETMRISKNPTTVMTANGEVQTKEEATVYVKELDLFVAVVLHEEMPTVHSLGKLCEDHGNTSHWTSGQKPHLTHQKGKRTNCFIANYVPFVVPGLSTSSSTSSSPDSSTSSSQDTVIGTENPATERSEILSEESRGNPSRGSAETKNTNKNEDDEELRSELLQDTLPALLMNFQWSREQKWYRVRVSTVSILTSRRTEIATSA